MSQRRVWVPVPLLPTSLSLFPPSFDLSHMHSLTHLHQRSYNHFVQSASSAITEFGIKFYFEGTSGRGEQTGVSRENSDSLPANWYQILNEKIQRPGRESNPHPPTLVISSLGQERVPRLTHWATDHRWQYTNISLTIITLLTFVLRNKKPLKTVMTNSAAVQSLSSHNSQEVQTEVVRPSLSVWLI